MGLLTYLRIAIVKYWVYLMYFAVAIILTWPLLINLDGFLLPREYPDISHSDVLHHLRKIDLTYELIQEGKYPITPDTDSPDTVYMKDVSQLYIFAGLLFIYGLGIDGIIFNNLFFLTVLFLSGYFMYLFAKDLFKKKPAFLAGLIYMSSAYIPYAYYWGHSNTVQIQFIPLIFLFLNRVLRSKKIKNTVMLGVALTLQVLAGSYHVIHLGFMVPFYLILYHRFISPLKFESLKKLLYSSGIALVLSSFYLIPKLMSFTPIRSIEENLMPEWRLTSLLDILNLNSFLFVGLVQFTLFVIGSIYIFRKDKKYVPYIILAVFTLFAMLGPISIIAPYYWLYKLVPLFNKLRVPFRMFPFLLFGISVVGAYATTKKQWIYWAVVALILLQTFFNPWVSGLHIFAG